MPEPIEAGSPADWLRYARSDLNLARIAAGSDVMLEMLCFHAQQAAEKSIKAVLLAAGIPFPRTHNIGTLLAFVPATHTLPTDVALAVSLTDYAVVNRYPGEYEEVSDVDYEEAIRLASAVVAWADHIVRGRPAL
jgi:HEPN domain-containing protein